MPLPFLWVNGRRDATISIMGANIYPEDVEALLYAQPDVATVLSSFQLRVAEDATGTPRPAVDLGCAGAPCAGTAGNDWRWSCGTALRRSTGTCALRWPELPGGLLPLVAAHPAGTGPFAGDARRIKQRRHRGGPRLTGAQPAPGLHSTSA